MKLIERTCKPQIPGEKSLRIGHWRRYALLIYLSRDSKAGAEAFCDLPGMKDFFEVIDTLFELLDPEPFNEYRYLTLDDR